MSIMTGYRLPTGKLTLNQPDNEPCERVTVYLAPGAQAEKDGDGKRRVYWGRLPFGADLEAALRRGWCSLEPRD